MNKNMHLPSVLAGVVLAGCALWLSAFSSQDEAPSAVTETEAAPQVGRYQLAVGDNMSAVLVLDTAKGKIWRWQDAEESSSWAFKRLEDFPRDAD